MTNAVLGTIISLVKTKIKAADDIKIDGECSLKSVGINSIAFVELIIALETEYKIKFEDEMLVSSAYPTLLTMAEYIVGKCIS